MTRRIILASTSRYRRALLEKLGVLFECCPPDYIEQTREGVDPAVLVSQHAEGKARSLALRYPDALIVGSDQVAVFEGEILGKPGTPQRAREQLRLLAGGEHQLMTAVGVLDSARGVWSSHLEVTPIAMRELTDEQIACYVERENPVDCAGSYKAESLGVALFRYQRGDDPTAVVGLPLIALCELLRQHGVEPLSRELQIRVLYRDEHVVCVNKPPGLLVHRSGESKDRVFLLQTLRDQLQAYLYPVHRLDRAASGLIYFAFSPESAKHLQQSLQHPESKKEYLTLVRGSTADAWESRRPLSNDNKVAQEAHSEFVKIAEFSRCSLLRVRIHTGRRHQIRRHLAHAAHQIIGDTQYGKGKINRFFREEYGLPRLFLHAWKSEIRHPVSGELLQLGAPLSADLRGFLQRLPDVAPALIEEL